MDFNRLKKRLWEQNKFNIRLKLKLEAIKVQFEDVSNYFKKKSHRIEQLKTVIDQLKMANTKTNIVLPLVEISIDTSQYFVYVLFFSANKSKSVLSMQQNLSKTFYND